MAHITTTTHSGKYMASVTLRGGFWFFFEVDGLEIAANGSTFSGKEIIYVNDNPVSEKRSFGVVSLHNFHYQGKHYRIKFDVVNLWTQEIECTLYVNGEAHSKETKAYVTGGVMGFFKTLFIAMLLGVGFGVTCALVIFAFLSL